MSENKPAWRSHVPPPISTSSFLLEPLCEDHVELDFAALMSCRARLRHELQWGDWPPEDFTIELNREDLGRHYGEFVRREAFAYTVLCPDRTRCIGCIYLERCDEVQGGQLRFWMIDDALDLETKLVDSVLQWGHDDWGIDRILMPMREANTRGISVVTDLGLVPWSDGQGDAFPQHVCFLSSKMHE